MKHNQFYLLRQKRFLPLFITQFLGAFHDNLFKNALVSLLLFNASNSAFSGVGEDVKVLVTLATGILILPFLLLNL